MYYYVIFRTLAVKATFSDLFSCFSKKESRGGDFLLFFALPTEKNYFEEQALVVLSRRALGLDFFHHHHQGARHKSCIGIYEKGHY
jgi:hypothetical protein